jgi:Fe2+ or Zn2+ uptake regulation protein
LPFWEKYFKQQIPTAYKLLKKFDATAIINALMSKKAWNIYSLRAPHLTAIIEEEQRLVDMKKQSLANAPELKLAEDESFRKNTKKSKLDLLDE